MTLVSRNIRYLRRLHGMTQEEFANKIGIKRPSLGAYEESRATPSLANLQIIAKTFDISVDELISLDIRQIKEKASIHTENNVFEEILGENLTEIPEEIFECNLEKKQTTIFENPQNNFPKEIQKEAQEIINKNLAKDLEEKINQQQNGFLNNFQDNFQDNLQDNFSEKKQNFQQDFQQEKTQKITYPTLETGFFTPQSIYNQGNNQHKKTKNDIPFIKLPQRNEYLASYDNPSFIADLPQLNLSLLAENEQNKENRDLRAFEMGQDFPQPKTVLIGEYSKNWYNLQDNYYVIVSQRQGVFYAKVENLLKTENYLKITTNNTNNDTNNGIFRLPLREIFEIWQPILMISAHLPEITANPNTKLYSLINDLQNEINQLRS